MTTGLGKSVSYSQVMSYRLLVNNLTDRLPPGEYERAARYALQDSAPRSALLSLHARVSGCESDAWADPRLVQTYSPRTAVHVLPRRDLGVFTIGRLPGSAAARRSVEAAADRVTRALGGAEIRASQLRRELRRDARVAAATGRIVVRWTTSAAFVRAQAAPKVDLETARIELCRRHIHAYAPTTPKAFAWWAGCNLADAERAWRSLVRELVPVGVDGHAAWMLEEDAVALRSAPPPRGVRLLPAEELRLFGQDRTGMFAGPGLNRVPPCADWFHPHPVVINGRITGAWGRRGGRIEVRLSKPLDARAKDRLEAEALRFPIPFVRMSVHVTVC